MCLKHNYFLEQVCAVYVDFEDDVLFFCENPEPPKFRVKRFKITCGILGAKKSALGNKY